jgi:integrase
VAGLPVGSVDPASPMLKWDTAWRALRDAAGLPGFRFHDLRHTVITELAEMGVADHVLDSITGHLTRRMLSTTRTSASTRSGRRSTPWTNSGSAVRPNRRTRRMRLRSRQ